MRNKHYHRAAAQRNAVGGVYRVLYLCFLLAVLFAFAGCSTVPTVRYETVEVKVPVRVPCAVETPALPTWVVPSLNENATIFDRVKALLADRELAAGYQAELAAALASCKK
jgi:hypothetical protein